FRGAFQVHAEGDSFVVRTATFETPAQYVAAKLAHPDYAHFVRAGTHGGAGGGGDRAAPTPPAQPAPPEPPRTLGDAVILHGKGPERARGVPRTALTLPFGLRAAR